MTRRNGVGLEFLHPGGREGIQLRPSDCIIEARESWEQTMAAMQTKDSRKGLSQLPSPPQSSAPADGEVTDLTYILGFLLLLGLGAMLIVVAWR
jgi:hypothetical protein